MFLGRLPSRVVQSFDSQAAFVNWGALPILSPCSH